MADDQVNSTASNLGMAFGGNPMKPLTTATEKGSKATAEMAKNSDIFLKNMTKAASLMSKFSGALDHASATGRLSESLGGFTSSLTGGQKLGLAGFGAAALSYSMMPNTAEAVTQRMTADTTMWLSGGNSATQSINKFNSQLGLGATSVGSPMATAATLMAGGFNPYSSKSLMNQVGGLSAMSGMSNQQVAAAYTNMNSMNFLRIGAKITDSKGNFKDPNQIINSVYNSMYGGQKITRDQALQANRSTSAAYQTIQSISGGDQNLQAMITSGIQFRAITGRSLTAGDLKDPNKVLDKYGIAKDDPMRANLNNIAAKNKLLGTTQAGLVSGYDKGLNANAALTNGFSDMLSVLGPINTALGNLKGILQSFPQAGSVSGTLSGLVSSLAGFALQMKMMQAMGLGGGGLGGMGGMGEGLGGEASTLAGAVGGETMMASGSAGMVGTAAGNGLLGRFTNSAGLLGKFGRMSQSTMGMKGALGFGAAGLAGTFLKGKLDKTGFAKTHPGLKNFGDLAAHTGIDAAYGASLGSVVPGVGTAVGAVAGTLWGLGTGLLHWGQGGPNQSIGVASTGAKGGGASLSLQSPVPKGTPVTSPYGHRQGGKNMSSNHQGIDFGVAMNTDITAAADGVVSEVGSGGGYKKYIIVKHGSKSTLYAHLNSQLVAKGDNVKSGQLIGKSGTAGTGPHLHFEVRDNGGIGAQGRVDPKPFLHGTGGFFSNIVSTISNFITGKNYGNDVNEQQLTFPNAQTHKGRFDSVASLNSPGLSTLLSNSRTTGEPISYADIAKYTSKSTLGSSKTTTIPGMPKGWKSVGGKPNLQLMKTIHNAGFSKKSQETAYAVAMAESTGRPNAFNGVSPDLSYGMFQINMRDDLKSSPNMGTNRRKQFHLASNDELFNPDTNAKAAHEISNKGAWWTPWSTYTSGKFSQYLEQAHGAAVATGIGGPNQSIGLGTVSSTSGMPSSVGHISSSGLSSHSNMNIKVNMQVNIAKSGVLEVEQMVREFEKQLTRKLEQEGFGRH